MDKFDPAKLRAREADEFIPELIHRTVKIEHRSDLAKPRNDGPNESYVGVLLAYYYNDQGHLSLRFEGRGTLYVTRPDTVKITVYTDNLGR